VSSEPLNPGRLNPEPLDPEPLNPYNMFRFKCIKYSFVFSAFVLPFFCSIFLISCAHYPTIPEIENVEKTIEEKEAPESENIGETPYGD
jgi:hypothetical protein